MSISKYDILRYMRTNSSRNIKDVFINILLIVVLVLLLLIPAYYCYKTFFADKVSIPTNIEVVDKEQDIQTQEEEPKRDILVIDEENAYKEFFPVIDDQQAYIVLPSQIDRDDPPVLVIYSHGSNTTVTQNMDDPFMKDLLEYGKYFTQHNYIFSASNQHGVNWGNASSVRDTLNLKNWVEANYPIQPTIYMIGYSMGGLPTMNFASEYPELISKIALLAPTTKSSQWNQARVDKIMNIDMKIWHGNADVNVPYSSTNTFVNTLKKYGKEVTFITLEGKTHWDLDIEYMEDILEYFSN